MPSFPPETSTNYKPASFPIRCLAFIADAFLATAISLLAVKYIIPEIYGNEWQIVSSEFTGIWEEYLQIINSGESAEYMQTASQKISEKINLLAQKEEFLSISSAASNLMFFTSLAFFTFSEYWTKGSSLGKKIFKLQIVSQLTGERPKFLQSFSRSIWRSVMIAPTGPIITLVAIINAFVPLFNSRRRALHDKLSRTEVVEKINDNSL